MRLSIPDPAQQIDLAGINLLDPHFYATGDPHAVWFHLRHTAPLYAHRLENSKTFWVATKYNDVCRILEDHTVFTSQHGTILCVLDEPDLAGGKMLQVTDPPRHTQLREPLGRALTPRAVGVHQPRLRRIVAELLAPGLSGEPWDFAAAAFMFPMAFTGVLMGLPDADWKRLCQLTTMSIAHDDPEFAEGSPNATLSLAHHELFEYFATEIMRRRECGSGDDLISLLMTMEAGGARLTDEEIIFNCYILLLAANATTPHAASATVMALAENPEEYRHWASHPELLTSGVEEGLRWSSPTNHFMRYALRDVELRGEVIRRGDAVTAWLGSANRDEEIFDDPYRFDVNRRPNRHVAFGIGPHFCIGAPLARLALHILFSELLRCVERIELVGPIEHLASNFVAGIKHMPVRLVLR